MQNSYKHIKIWKNERKGEKMTTIDNAFTELQIGNYKLRAKRNTNYVILTDILEILENKVQNKKDILNLPKQSNMFEYVEVNLKKPAVMFDKSQKEILIHIYIAIDLLCYYDKNFKMATMKARADEAIEIQSKQQIQQKPQLCINGELILPEALDIF